MNEGVEYRPFVRHARIVGITVILALSLCALALVTARGMRPLPKALTPDGAQLKRVQFLDRLGTPLSRTYENAWNFQDQKPLHMIPEFLQSAILAAEDSRFYSHRGNDWKGLAAALYQNAKNLRVVRGGSTITEQVVRMIHPRARTIWARWLEIFEARELEKHFSKADILEFYLNQVPFARNRRGVQAAALDLFDRDLDTLSKKEMLALAVLIRAPGKLDPRGLAQDRRLQSRMNLLADRLIQAGKLSAQEKEEVLHFSLSMKQSHLPVQAAHFLRYANRRMDSLTVATSGRLRATLDGPLQAYVQKLLDQRVLGLREKRVSDAAALVVDNESSQIMAWVNAGEPGTSPHGEIDAVLSPRQPGSTLKPFLYASALSLGWTPATLIDDSPLRQAVGAGVKPFRNYSGIFYGPLRLREALGNSLNIPAVRTVEFVGQPAFYKLLHELGFDTLKEHPDYYGEGLALGNGEVRLYDLVRAYHALASRGRFMELQVLADARKQPQDDRQVFSPDVSSLVTNILSDPVARQYEFGTSSLLNFPVETAVKTGTSSDYRDAWAVGYSARFTVGVWMGNLDRTPMLEVTGSTGPAIVLRAIFARLERYGDPEPLWLSQNLAGAKICRISGALAGPYCPKMHEWFLPGTEPKEKCTVSHEAAVRAVPNHPLNQINLELPTPGLQLALDPRIPDEREAFPLLLPEDIETERTEWLMDGSVIGRTGPGERRLLWQVQRGQHTAQARVWVKSGGSAPVITEPVNFEVRG